MSRLFFPRYGNLAALCPAAGGGGPTTLISDAFTDTDGTNLSAHSISPTNTPATSWSILSGAFDINSNRARQTGTGTIVAVVDAGQADVTISCVLRMLSTSDSPAIAFRCSDASNFWIATLVGGATFDLYEYNAATLTQRATTPFVHTINTNYTLQVVLSGTSITATVDGGNQITYGSATFNQTATKHGLRSNNGSANEMLWDSFTITQP